MKRLDADNDDCAVLQAADISVLTDKFVRNKCDRDLSGCCTSKVTTLRQMFRGALTFREKCCPRNLIPISGDNDTGAFLDEHEAMALGPHENEFIRHRLDDVVLLSLCLLALTTLFSVLAARFSAVYLPRPAKRCAHRRRRVTVLAVLLLVGGSHMASASETRATLDALVNRCNANNNDCAALEAADVSTITDMSGLFASMSAINPNISGWNTHLVTDMASMFIRADAFNAKIGGWNTSSVTSMQSMFFEASAFNADISGWNTAKVTTMESMFYGAVAFNSDLSRWDTSSVAAVDNMFARASSFNSNLSGWDMSSVSYMTAVFNGAYSFNGDISRWDTSSVTVLFGVFAGASAFNSDLSRWNTSLVTTPSYLFSGASAFNGDISLWDMSSVTFIDGMFLGASSFNSDISRWDVSSVQNMDSMFQGASVFNADISGWDTAKVVTMWGMFEGASAFNAVLSRWDVSAVVDMSQMFRQAISFNADISGWDTSSVTENYYGMALGAGVGGMQSMFEGAVSFNLDISAWDTSSVASMQRMFYDATAFDRSLCSWNKTTAERDEMFGGTSPKTGLCCRIGTYTDKDNSCAACPAEATCGGEPALPLCNACHNLTATADGNGFVCVFTAQFSPEDIDGIACASAPFNRSNCQEARTWDELLSVFEDTGADPAFITGGLGKLMTTDKFEVWACMRGHPCLDEAGMNPAQDDFMCFVYDEDDNRFIPWNKQSSLNLF